MFLFSVEEKDNNRNSTQFPYCEVGCDGALILVLGKQQQEDYYTCSKFPTRQGFIV